MQLVQGAWPQLLCPTPLADRSPLSAPQPPTSSQSQQQQQNRFGFPGDTLFDGAGCSFGRKGGGMQSGETAFVTRTPRSDPVPVVGRAGIVERGDGWPLGNAGPCRNLAPRASYSA
ncbi:hypothetical protein IscW_ISCW008729 [Ixodes scapularis]|uniref:Uncharacterized protein n=1 Tax=Ixodes scapularis TaxID=6945 RepID=B7Q1W8_IXOSC|nr:hypothetical protein IscW_ISCW008729 [Ixodes scapularis]|eukprot:XP_002410202.1 hypothetical protein IscW_ISCW008729 [Ixodes scapularis]